jgi:hypothetical protein
MEELISYPNLRACGESRDGGAPYVFNWTNEPTTEDAH